MSTKDERPGLLSKVAMFVRNPTKDWSELDQPEQEQDAGAYDRQALKAMIERKRQNDFVRKREFDQLRRLRNRDPADLANVGRPSFFQNSVPIDDDGREVTLKKIDEIEAQMSKQWWKGRAPDGTRTTPSALDSVPPSQPATGASVPGGASQPGASSLSAGSAMDSEDSLHTNFEATVPTPRDDDSVDPSDFAPTVMATGPASIPPADMGSLVPPLDEVHGLGLDEFNFADAGLAVADAHEMATDSELEEAAIRFANGDDSGAEGALLAALRGNDLEPGAARSWAAALLDLYRATDQRSRFDSAVLEFSLHLYGALPSWQSLAAARPQSDATQRVVATWVSPGVLSLAEVEVLRAAMAAQPAPWRLDWGELHRVAPDAMPLLETLFDSLVEDNVSLVFTGAERLVHALRVMTPSGETSIPQGWWQLRLNALRVLRQRDDFELAALDYSVTYEQAPPLWLPARCQCERLLADAPAPEASGVAGTEVQDGTLTLQGEVLGDASGALEGLTCADDQSTKLVVHCDHLLRVDFGAAGSILNWLTARHAEGRQIQFTGVQRMVAAFFYVIGINEYAKVVPRAI